MTLFVYDSETNRLLAKVEGDSTFDCERKANAWGGLEKTDEIRWTYSASFNQPGGLTDNGDAVEID